MLNPKEWLWQKFIGFLTQKPESVALSPHDTDCLHASLKPADVLLLEGRSRVGSIIKIITRSSWSHSAICIGSLNSIKEPELKDRVAQHWQGDPDELLLLEAEIDRGTVVTPFSHYLDYHMRICKPIGLSREDRRTVVAYAIEQIGATYSVHQLLDLARFLVPWWTFIPRRWHSSLFEHNAGEPTRTVCSSLIANAFRSVDFPILPLIQQDAEGKYRLFRRNPKLFVPRDFDYSPFFEVVKCPLLVGSKAFSGKPKTGYYRKLEWVDEPGHEENESLRELAEAHDILHVSGDGSVQTIVSSRSEESKREADENHKTD
jgi:hypothetical protein